MVGQPCGKSRLQHSEEVLLKPNIVLSLQRFDDRTHVSQHLNCGRLTHKEHDRAPDGVAVSRYDAPTEEMCALYEFARWRDLYCLTMNGERLDFRHLAPRPYQPDHERSDRPH